MAINARAIGMDYTDFKHQLTNDVWPEVSRSAETHHRSCESQVAARWLTSSCSCKNVFVYCPASNPHHRCCFSSLLLDQSTDWMNDIFPWLISCFAFHRSYELIWFFYVTTHVSGGESFQWRHGIMTSLASYPTQKPENRFQFFVDADDKRSEANEKFSCFSIRLYNPEWLWIITHNISS